MNAKKLGEMFRRLIDAAETLQESIVGATLSQLSAFDCNRVHAVLVEIIRCVQECYAAVFLVLADVPARTALLQVVAITMRINVASAGGDDPHLQLVNAAYRLVRSVLNVQPATTLRPHQTRALLDFAHRLLRLQLLHCASQHLATASQQLRPVLSAAELPDAQLHGGGAEAAAGEALEGAPHGAAAAAASATASLPDIAAFERVRLILEAVLLLIGLDFQLPNHHEDPLRPSYRARLGHSLQRSSFLEHASQAYVVVEQTLAVHGLTLAGSGSRSCSGSASDSASQAVADDQRLLDLEWTLQTISDTLLTAYLQLRSYQMRNVSPAAAKAFDAVLAGPCLQHLVISVGVRALATCDGGTVYGMAPELWSCLKVTGILPSEHDVPPALLADCRWKLASTAPLLAMVLALALCGDGGGGGSSGSPLPGRWGACQVALRAAQLALDAAAVFAAMDEVAAGRGDSSGEGSSSSQGRDVLQPAGPGQQGLRALVPRMGTVVLAAAAMDAVRWLLDGGESSGSGRWLETATARWRMAASAVGYAVRWRDDPTSTDQLVQLLLPCWGAMLPADGSTPMLPAAAPPEVAAALDGGLLPCLESLLRRACREPPGGKAAKLMGALLGALDVDGWLGRLVMYGSPRQSAAMVATFGKALRRWPMLMSPAAVARGSSAARAEHDLNLLYLLAACTCQILHDGPAWLHAAAAGGAAAAVRQLATLVSAAVVAWSGVSTARVVQGADPGKEVSRFHLMILSLCVRCLQLMLADMAPAEAAAGGGASAVRPTGWRLAAVRDMLPVALCGSALRCAWRMGFPETVDPVPGVPASLADALCRVAVTFRVEVREAAVAGAAASAAAAAASGGRTNGEQLQQNHRRGGGGSRRGRGGRGPRSAHNAAAASASEVDTPPSHWPPGLVRALAVKLKTHGSHNGEAAATAVEALAAQLETWGAGGLEEVAIGPWAAVLPLPCQPEMAAAAALLASPSELCSQLHCCANPACANLEGDSEAGLRLAACGRCGAVGYCCKECQRAHWAAGHKAACGRGRDQAA